VQHCEIYLSTDVNLKKDLSIEIFNKTVSTSMPDSDRPENTNIGKINMDHFQKDNVWDYQGDLAQEVTFKCKKGTERQQIKYSVIFRRRSLYYIVNIVFPSLLFGFICLFIFVLPGDSGERLGCSLSVLISVSVFQGLVMSEIPKTTDTIPILVLFLNILMSLVGISTIATTIISKLYSNTLLYFDHQVPEKLWDFCSEHFSVYNVELLNKLQTASRKEKELLMKIKEESIGVSSTNLTNLSGKPPRPEKQPNKIHRSASLEDEPNTLLRDKPKRYDTTTGVRFRKSRKEYRKTVKKQIQIINQQLDMSENLAEEFDCDHDALQLIENKKVVMEVRYLQCKYIAMCLDKLCFRVYLGIYILIIFWFFSHYFMRFWSAGRMVEDLMSGKL